MAASDGGKIEAIKLLVKHGADINAQNNDRETPLMYAASAGKFEAVKLLVKHGANINARNNFGHTALMRAANFGHYDVVRFLVENGADTNVSAYNDPAATAYGYADLNGHHQIADYLESRTRTASSKKASLGSGAFKMFAGMPQDKGNFLYYGATCVEGGWAFVNVQKDNLNFYCYSAGGGSSGRSSCEAGIGVEAGLRKACGGN